MSTVHDTPPWFPRGLGEALPAIDAAQLRLLRNPRDARDCDLARDLLFARVEVASAAEAMEDMVTTREAREAVQMAASFAGLFGLVFGLLIGAAGPEFFARIFG